MVLPIRFKASLVVRLSEVVPGVDERADPVA